MNIRKSVESFLGIRPVDVSALNRRVLGPQVKPQLDRSGLDRVPERSSDEIIVSEQYKEVLAHIKAKTPVVFVTGNAGTGKSTLIRYLESVLDLRFAVVAPTGVAALNVGGATIHSFFRLPPKIHTEVDIKRVAFNDREMYEKLQLLIIDEISMVRSDLIDSIDSFLRKNRSSEKPFGGVQLLLVGDLFQLPPVTPKREWDVLRDKGYISPYFFNSFSLQQTSLTAIELTENYRQESLGFVKLLNTIRVGDDLDNMTRELNARCLGQDGSVADLTVTSTNHRATHINRSELQRLPNNEFSFAGKIEGNFNIGDRNLPSPVQLKLKLGARVMFTKNDEHKRWVNGSLGTVTEIGLGTIKVELLKDSRGNAYDVLPVTWEKYKYAYDQEEDSIVGRVDGSYTQYPLMLAWAVTIHKSQGKTLDNVLIDLGEGAFDFGQVYVALSRCRSIEGIQLVRPLRTSDVKCDPVIKRFYLAIEDMSNDLASIS
jgi:ATP-dependent DNA helicase PIF1